MPFFRFNNKKIDQDDELYRNILKEKIIIIEDLNDSYKKNMKNFFFIFLIRRNLEPKE